MIIYQTSFKRIALTDVMVICFLVLFPAVAHYLPFPGYYLEPMRIALLTALFLSGSKTNTFMLAILIPFGTMILSGHPPFIKTVLISIELLTNVAIFYLLSSKLPLFIRIYTGIVLSKIIYYFLKAGMIQMTLIEGSLITISLWIQLLIAGILSIVFAVIFKKSANV